jgi:hypothetical protein
VPPSRLQSCSPLPHQRRPRLQLPRAERQCAADVAVGIVGGVSVVAGCRNYSIDSGVG